MGSLLPETCKAGLDSFLREVFETSNLPSMTSRYLCHTKHITVYVLVNKNIGLRLWGVRTLVPPTHCYVAQGHVELGTIAVVHEQIWG